MLKMVSLTKSKFSQFKISVKAVSQHFAPFFTFCNWQGFNDLVDCLGPDHQCVWALLDFTEFCLLQILNFSLLLRTSWNISLLQFPYKIFNSDSDFNLYYYIQKINPTYLNFIKYGLWFMNLNIAFINLSKRNYGL